MSTIQAIQQALKDPVAIQQIPKSMGDKDQQEDEEKIMQSPNNQVDEGLSNREHTLEKEDADEIIDMDQLHFDIEYQQQKRSAKIIQQNDETNTTNSKSRTILKELRTMSSSVLDDNYFKEDTHSSEKLQIKRAQADVSKIKNYFIKFRFGQFFEFFLIHFLYYQILGPFIIPFLNMRGKFLAKNLMFYGWNLFSVIQFLLYFTNITCLVFYFYYDNPSITLEIEMLNNTQSVIARCVIIACKYATFDPLKIEIIRCTDITLTSIVKDFFLTDWIQQSPIIAAEQIYFSVRSYDIDPGLFFLQFIVDPDVKTRQQLLESEKIINESICKNNTCKKPKPVAKMKDNDELYCGYTIIYDMIKYFKERSCSFTTILIRITLLFSFVRAIIPIAYRFWTFGAAAYGSWHEYYIAIASAVQLFSLYSFGSKIMLYGLIDVMRKLEMLRQLTFMIAPRKLRNLDMKKLYPTINIFRSVNLKGWSLMRQVCMEYGKPYLLRIQGFFFFLGFWIAGNISQIVLNQFHLMKQNTAQTIQNYLDCVYTLTLLFSMLVVGAKINDLFELQESILNSNKTIVTDLLLVGQKYIEKMKKSPSFIYNKAIEKIIEVSPEDIESYVNNLVEQYDSHIEELIYDSSYNPFTLFGIKVSFVILQSLIIAVGGVVVTIISTMFNKN